MQKTAEGPLIVLKNTFKIFCLTLNSIVPIVSPLGASLYQETPLL
jgi:hypothetical protein